MAEPVKGFKVVDGIVKDTRVMPKSIAQLDHGAIGTIHAIVVHQTASSTAKGTITSWTNDPKGTGAHFLIDKDGTIYQTLSVTRRAWHVGALRVRCFEEHTCTPDQTKALASIQKLPSNHAKAMAFNALQNKLAYPVRYPSNSDSIGIEIVSLWLGDDAHPEETEFEVPTPQQQQSLQWLVTNLLDALHLTRTDVYRHAQIANKKAGEARNAAW